VRRRRPHCLDLLSVCTAYRIHGSLGAFLSLQDNNALRFVREASTSQGRFSLCGLPFEITCRIHRTFTVPTDVLLKPQADNNGTALKCKNTNIVTPAAHGIRNILRHYLFES